MVTPERNILAIEMLIGMREPARLEQIGEVLQLVGDLYVTCYLADEYHRGSRPRPRPLRPRELLVVGSMQMRSPLHIVAATEVGEQAEKALTGVAGLLDTAATLRSRSKTAKADAKVSEGTVEARTLSVQASAQKAVAEARQAEAVAKQAEAEAASAQLHAISDAADLADRFNAEDLKEAALRAARELLGIQADPSAVESAADTTVRLAGVLESADVSIQLISESDDDE